jgi:hypothetical protein
VSGFGYRGYRCWRLVDGDLWPPFTGGQDARVSEAPWSTIMTSDCNRHSWPVLKCHCGLYAWMDRIPVGNSAYIAGIVEPAGEIIQSREWCVIGPASGDVGFRAQAMKILCLVHDKPQELRETIGDEIPIVSTWGEAEAIAGKSDRWPHWMEPCWSSPAWWLSYKPTSRIKIFCDFDGCLTNSPDAGGELINMALRDRLAKLVAYNDIEFKWLSLNRYEAERMKIAGHLREFIDYSDWPTWKPEFAYGDNWWKLHAIKREIAREPGPFVWIDDLLYRYPAAHDWVEATGIPSLAIWPNGRVGLWPGALDAIENFVNLVTKPKESLVSVS